MTKLEKIFLKLLRVLQVLLGLGHMVLIRYSKSEIASFVSLWRTAKASKSIMVRFTVIDAPG